MLRGLLWSRGAHLVVLIHDAGGDLDDWGSLPAALSVDGYAVLALDLPGHGMSDDPWEPDRSTDLMAGILAHARTLTDGKCFAMSMGSMASPIAEAGFDAVIAVSPTPDSAIQREAGRTPCLIFVGSADGQAANDADRYFRSRVGWTVSSSFGIAANGPDLLRSLWAGHIREQTVAFLRDYQ